MHVNNQYYIDRCHYVHVALEKLYSFHVFVGFLNKWYKKWKIDIDEVRKKNEEQRSSISLENEKAESHEHASNCALAKLGLKWCDIVII